MEATRQVDHRDFDCEEEVAPLVEFAPALSFEAAANSSEGQRQWVGLHCFSVDIVVWLPWERVGRSDTRGPVELEFCGVLGDVATSALQRLN